MPLEQPDGSRVYDVPLDRIQGNITPGFRKDRQMFILFRFPSDSSTAPHAVDAVRNWIGELRPDISTGLEVATFNRRYKRLKERYGEPVSRFARSTWVNIAFTAEGLRKLRPAAES